MFISALEKLLRFVTTYACYRVVQNWTLTSKHACFINTTPSPAPAMGNKLSFGSITCIM